MIETSFEIVDANTVEQIARDDFQALPLKSYTLNVGKDFAWNKKRTDNEACCGEAFRLPTKDPLKEVENGAWLFFPQYFTLDWENKKVIVDPNTPQEILDSYNNYKW